MLFLLATIKLKMLQGRNVIGTRDLSVRVDYVLYLHFSKDSWPEMKFCYPVNCLGTRLKIL